MRDGATGADGVRRRQGIPHRRGHEEATDRCVRGGGEGVGRHGQAAVRAVHIHVVLWAVDAMGGGERR